MAHRNVVAHADQAGHSHQVRRGGLRPHRARHTFATRLRQGGADPAQVQALLGYASIDTAARYFVTGSTENAEVVERVFSD